MNDVIPYVGMCGSDPYMICMYIHTGAGSLVTFKTKWILHTCYLWPGTCTVADLIKIIDTFGHHLSVILMIWRP